MLGQSALPFIVAAIVVGLVAGGWQLARYSRIERSRACRPQPYFSAASSQTFTCGYRVRSGGLGATHPLASMTATQGAITVRAPEIMSLKTVGGYVFERTAGSAVRTSTGRRF